MASTHDATVGGRPKPIVLGRYVLCEVIGGGGMAKVHLGRILGAAGFSRVVAIKRLHANHAADPRIAAMLVDEARLVSRIRHPNVVPTLDVVAMGNELLLVMEYVHGLPVAELVRLAAGQKERLPLPITARIVLDMLAGLEAAHEATSERGRPLRIVHRDVSPQNVLVGADGIARIADFGIAKAEGKLATTQAGQIKGKLAYMAPEQLRAEELDRRTDLYAVGIMLWELVVGRRLFDKRRAHDIARVIGMATLERVDVPSKHAAGISPELDAVVAKALEPTRERRFATASEMAAALEAALPAANAKDVGAYVAGLGRAVLAARSEVVMAIEQATPDDDPITLDDARRPSAAPSRPSVASDPTGSLELHRPAALAPTTIPQGPVTTGPPPAGPSLRWLLVALLFVSSAMITAVAILLMHRRGPTMTTPAASVPVVVSTPSPPATEAPAVVEPPASLASAAPSTVPIATAPSASARKRTKPVTPGCDPPYRIDERGIRILRRECLGQ